MPQASDEYWDLWKEALGYAGAQVSPEQEEIVRCANRLILVAGGEQAGKSHVATVKLFTRMWGKNPLYWLVGDDYAQSQKEFEYLITFLQNVGAVRDKEISMPLRGSWQLKMKNGITVVTKTAKDITKLAREAPSGIIMCEAAQMTHAVYLKCRGRIAPRRGWLMLVGTFEAATDWYAQLYKRWQGPNPEKGKSFCLPAWANRALYPGGREDKEILKLEAELPPEVFAMRIGASPMPPPTMIFPQFDFSIHQPGDVAFRATLDGSEEKVPVQLWIDPGYSGSWYTVEVVQIVGPDKHVDAQHVHVIDEVRAKFATTAEVIEVCRGREWWDNVAEVIVDVAARQHTGAGMSIAEMWGDEGLPVYANRLNVEDGIAVHRNFLKEPGTGRARIFFSENCVGAFEEYGTWKRRKRAETGDVEPKPMKNNCDAMKCINYGLVENFGYVDREDAEPAYIPDPFA